MPSLSVHRLARALLRGWYVMAMLTALWERMKLSACHLGVPWISSGRTGSLQSLSVLADYCRPLISHDCDIIFIAAQG